ncbi:MAG: methyltransferase domain-containing protein [Candidatus Omnitrophica bacterium]|nr:methyltransferase domain-containing protein [Candidatus Omnitrophota bacterium]
MAKQNHLLEKIVSVIAGQKKGKVLDMGCGDGKTGKRLLDLGFDVEACDMDSERFEFKGIIPFTAGNLDHPLPYADGTFDYVIFMEVIEHIYNPGFVISEISRILRPGGQILLSTPNILNIASRFRFLLEGSFDFFREPTLDYAKCFPVALQNMHVVPWRYQELEYLLYQYDLVTHDFHIDQKKVNLYLPLLLMRPFLWLQAKTKEWNAKKKGSVDFARMNKILLSDDMLLGKHLIMRAVKA